MSKDPMQPGQAFHLPAAQQANMNSLLKIFSSKKATEALTELGKTKDSAWSDIAETVVGLNEFVLKGGLASIKETFKTQIDAILSPLTNEVNQIVADLLSDTGLKEQINIITNEFAQLIGTLFAEDSPLGKTTRAILGGLTDILKISNEGWQLLLGIKTEVEDIDLSIGYDPGATGTLGAMDPVLLNQMILQNLSSFSINLPVLSPDETRYRGIVEF